MRLTDFLKPISLLLSVWFLLIFINYLLHRIDVDLGTPIWFPISVFSIANHFNGVPYLLVFLFVLFVIYNSSLTHLKFYHIWLLGTFLIIIGNFGQGGWDAGFLQPFYKTGIQYYHDAIKIVSWKDWLRSFNTSQESLLCHSKTHPPFAVLIHFFILYIANDNLNVLAIIFTLISSLSIIIVWFILKILNISLEKRNVLSILFSVIPAVNIYSATSIDGVILTTSTLSLLGLVQIAKSQRATTIGVIFMTLGLIFTNLLTYAGVFLIAVIGLQAIKEIIIFKKNYILKSFFISISIFALIMLVLWSNQYSHIQGLLTASHIENPDGFRLLSSPYEYFGTRIEDVSEIMLFLSFGFLSIFFYPNHLNISWSDINISIIISGLIVLCLMFFSGAYRTGETARGALFIYPYLLLFMTNVNLTTIRNVMLLAGLQTFYMQLFGFYFW